MFKGISTRIQILLFALFLSLGTLHAQTVTLSNEIGAATSIKGGETDVAILGFTLTRGTAVSLTGVAVTFSDPISGIFSNIRLYESTDDVFSLGDTNIGTMSPAAGDDYDITFGARPIAAGGTTYYVVADVDPDILSTSSISVSCLASQITTTDAETGSADGPLYNSANITELTASFSQNSDDVTGVADQNNVVLLDFSVVSNGVQSITNPLIFTFDIDVSGILESWDLRVDGVDIPGTETYNLTGGGKILTVTNFTDVDISSAKQIQLLADIDQTVDPATDDFTVTLESSDVEVTSGYKQSFGTYSNSIDIIPVALTFVPIPAGTAPVQASTVLGAGSTMQVLTGFSVTSNGTQTISEFDFSYTPGAAIVNEYIYKNTVPGTLAGATIAATDTSPDGDFTTGVNETITSGTTVYYYLVVEVASNVTTSTTGITIDPTEAGITVDNGIVNPFSINRSFTFSGTMLSNIIVDGGTTDNILYFGKRNSPMSDDGSNSVSIARLKLQDGGGSNDPDNLETRLTDLTIQLTNHAMIKRIALYDDAGNEIANTEKTVSAATVNWNLTATPIIATEGNGFEYFTVRVIFQNNNITDGLPVHVTVTAASFDPTKSGFASPDAGGATTTGLAAPANIVQVVATSLAFIANPPTTPKNSNFSLTVQARDPLNNIDLDYAGQIELTATVGPGSLSLAPASTESLTPHLSVITPGAYDWTTLRLSQSGTYTLTASDGPYLNDLGPATGSITITSSASTITPSTDPVLCYGGSTAFESIGNIVVTETDAGGISGSNGSYTFSLALPSGFVFDQSVTSGLVLSGGSDLSTPSGYTYPGDNVVQFSFQLNGSSNTNTITIGGLKARFPHPGIALPAPTGALSITRLGGTATIAGVNSGVVLGAISASQQNAAVTFGVAGTGGIIIEANTTTFNINSNAVKLNGTGSPAGVFNGSAVTGTYPNYFFNPSSLPAGTYPITYTQTSALGCQSFASKDFNVIAAGITNLKPSYCTNEPTSLDMSVSQAYVDQVMGGSGWLFDHFVYYNVNSFNFVPITSPSNLKFNPSLPEYQASYQYFASYGEVGFPVGFAVCNNSILYPCNGSSTYIGTYSLIALKPAPAVSFDLPSLIFCEDNVPVTLVGKPANSNDILTDNFIAGGTGSSAISHALVSGKEVWTFSPASVTGIDDLTPEQTFNITYAFKDPTTACSNTFTRSIKVKQRPAGLTSVTPASKKIELCQGASVASFSLPSTPGTTFKWYDDASRTSLRGTGNTFTPPIDNTVAGTSDFFVTQTTGEQLFPFFAGCESDGTPLKLDVEVFATPPPPTVADPTLEYCVNQTIPDLVAVGTKIRWYTDKGVFIIESSSASPATLGINNTVAGSYSFYATQTLNNCEGAIPANATLVTVTIKALPDLSITSSVDPLKICKTHPSVTFSGLDLGSPATSPPGTASWTGVSAIIPNPPAGTAQLNPSLLNPGNYTLNFIYQNGATGCSNSTSMNFTILPTITPLLTPLDSCDQLFVRLNNQSTINNGSLVGTPPTIVATQWNFADGTGLPFGAGSVNDGKTKGTYFNPEHKFNNTGSFTIQYTMQTSDGCTVAATKQLTIYPKPNVNFAWTNACMDGTVSSTQFHAATNPALPIIQYNWLFNVNGNLSYASAGAGNNPVVNYNVTGRDSVKLIVTTNAHCLDTIQKPVYIVPSYSTITETNSYFQNFDGANDGWIAGGVNSSWMFGKPNGAVVNTDASGNGNAWDTNLTGNSNTNEQSWVLSPCYDFSQAVKPIIALDIWSDTPSGNDGAVLQYNENGNISNDANWIVVGQLNQGANWYNENGISSSPGNQASNDVGWTGVYNGWRQAAYKLDNLVGKSNIVFRIAFASNTPRREGFAFDNVFIGERTRTVLLESFTNSSSATNAKLHNDVFSGFSNNSSEIAKIEFHTPFPGVDPLNAANPQINNSRTAFYGITSSPTFSLDGTILNTAASLNSFYNDRVLIPSPIRINVNQEKDGNIVRINVSLTNTTNQIISKDGLHAFITIVEKTITDPLWLGGSGNTQFNFVARQMLPSAAGLTLTQDIAPLATITLPEVTWSMNDLITSGNGAIVVFVQSIEGGNKNVLQSTIVNATEEPQITTETEHFASGSKIKIYPNPASEAVTIELPYTLSKNTPIKMFDVNGHEIHNTVFEKGKRIMMLSTRECSSGVYLIQIDDGNSIVRKKVMVVQPDR